MKDNRFTEISDAELFAVNGGGLGGAAAGLFIGGAAGFCCLHRCVL